MQCTCQWYFVGCIFMVILFLKIWKSDSFNSVSFYKILHEYEALHWWKCKNPWKVKKNHGLGSGKSQEKLCFFTNHYFKQLSYNIPFEPLFFKLFTKDPKHNNATSSSPARLKLWVHEIHHSFIHSKPNITQCFSSPQLQYKV